MRRKNQRFDYGTKHVSYGQLQSVYTADTGGCLHVFDGGDNRALSKRGPESDDGSLQLEWSDL